MLAEVIDEWQTLEVVDVELTGSQSGSNLKRDRLSKSALCETYSLQSDAPRTRNGFTHYA